MFPSDMVSKILAQPTLGAAINKAESWAAVMDKDAVEAAKAAELVWYSKNPPEVKFAPDSTVAAAVAAGLVGRLERQADGGVLLVWRNPVVTVAKAGGRKGGTHAKPVFYYKGERLVGRLSTFLRERFPESPAVAYMNQLDAANELYAETAGEQGSQSKVSSWVALVKHDPELARDFKRETA